MTAEKKEKKMISISTVNDALKTFYLDVIVNQLENSISPLYKQFKTNEKFVTGKNIVKPVCYGLSSGFSALDEYEDLPTSDSNKYALLRSELRNLYGSIEITDKALRASENNEGAVVNLLDAEMEGLITSAKLKFSRMLYGDGTAIIAHATQATTNSKTVHVDNVMFFKVGMDIEIIDSSNLNDVKVTAVGTDTITVDENVTCLSGAAVHDYNAQGKEIDGLQTLFNLPGTLYGVTTTGKAWLKPHIGSNTGSISDVKIQTMIDKAEIASGGRINFITCSHGVRRAYQEYLETTKRNINPVELEGGFKAISYSGIPVVADRFCPSGTMFMLDTTLFDLHQLCDWSWLEGDNGSVLKQMANKAAYSATLVKYANLVCSLPCGQAQLIGITES